MKIFQTREDICEDIKTNTYQDIQDYLYLEWFRSIGLCRKCMLQSERIIRFKVYALCPVWLISETVNYRLTAKRYFDINSSFIKITQAKLYIQHSNYLPAVGTWEMSNSTNNFSFFSTL